MFKRLGDMPREVSFILRNNTGNQALRNTGSMAMGVGCVSIGSHQTVLGRYNVPDEDAQFIIGSGNGDTDRDTGFLIDERGISRMAGGDVLILDDATNCYIPIFVNVRGEILPVRLKHIQ